MKTTFLAALAAATMLTGAASAQTYTSDPYNGEQPGGGQGQTTSLTAFGQFFTSNAGGMLSSLRFLDSDSTSSGTNLIVRSFDTNTMMATGNVLFSGAGTVSAYGIPSFADGNGGYVSYFYDHTFSNIGVNLAAGQAYIAYLVNAPGTDTFNGTTSYGYTYDDDGNLVTDPPNQCSQFGCDDSNTPVGTVGNGSYAFGLGKYDSAIGGAGVYQNANGAFVKTQNPTPGQSAYFQADYSITIDPAAPSVPEPATWAMMLVGFAMVGATARYRRRKTAVVYA